MKTTRLPALALLLLTQCQKKDPDPASQLPAATQTGANTFGCLVNGQVWMPQGYNGTSNYSVSADPTFHGGNMDVRAYRYTNNLLQSIIIGGDSIKAVGVYSLTGKSKSIYFTDMHLQSSCQSFDGSAGQYRRGTLTITRLDMKAGVVSGTFAFTLYKPGCDTIKVTQGRFDKRL